MQGKRAGALLSTTGNEVDVERTGEIVSSPAAPIAVAGRLDWEFERFAIKTRPCLFSTTSEVGGMNSRFLKLAILLTLSGVCGCQTRQQPASTRQPVLVADEKKSVDPVVRNNALALLNDLLGDEKNLGKILLIKLESDELDRLVEAISKTAADGVKMLEAMAKADPNLDFKNLGLPSGEQATRKAIAKTKRSLLLHSSGPDFEFQLLQTQIQALSYGAHLAQVIAENESDPTLTGQFTNLSTSLNQLQERVVTMLRK